MQDDVTAENYAASLQGCITAGVVVEMKLINLHSVQCNERYCSRVDGWSCCTLVTRPLLIIL